MSSDVVVSADPAEKSVHTLWSDVRVRRELALNITVLLGAAHGFVLTLGSAGGECAAGSLKGTREVTPETCPDCLLLNLAERFPPTVQLRASHSEVGQFSNTSDDSQEEPLH